MFKCVLKKQTRVKPLFMCAFILVIVSALQTAVASAATLRIAVASNFLAASKVIAQEFNKETGNKISISSGSTGKLYAQIVNGAPYDIFMAANAREPQRLIDAGIASAASLQTYAIGRLVLFSTRLPLKGQATDQILAGNNWHKLAIANPKTAPYGVAAKQVLQHLDIWSKIQSRLVRGENIGQTFYFAQSGNVDIGLVALSQIKSQPDPEKLKYCDIPQKWYQPLEQKAVLLKRSRAQKEAGLFLTFLQSQRVKLLLTQKYGYGVPGK